MKSLCRSVVPALILSNLVLDHLAHANTLPSGAIPVSGSFIVITDPSPSGPPTEFPIQVLDGMVLVLTDVSFGRGYSDINLYAAEDLTNPRFGFYKGDANNSAGTYMLQTGLVFSAAPWVKISQGGDLAHRALVSFSGYFLPASQ